MQREVKPDLEAETEQKPAFPITLRAVLLGAIAVGLLGVINPYLAWVSLTWDVGSGSLLQSPVFVLFLLVILNSLLIRIWPGRAFSRAELLTAYGMMMISVGMATLGGLPYMVSATTYPFYMATPQNGWEHLIWPQIPLFLQLSSPEGVAWFWEGSPEGMGVPWGAWLTPMLAWGSFTLALMAGMFSLGALLRRDWIERQRLTFPLVDVPLSIVGDAPRPSFKDSILNNRVFWLGFALPALFVTLGWFHRLYPSVPSPQLVGIEAGRYFAAKGLPWSVLSGPEGIRFSIVFPIIGISCLLPAEVLLSLWLFYVFFQLQLLTWASFGVTEATGSGYASFFGPRSFIGFQEAGGFFALTGVTIWQSRKAIRAAWLGLIGRARQEPDPYTPLAGRWALLVFLLANGFMFWWAAKTGMSWWAFAAIIGMFYAVLVGASRLVAAGGVMYVDTGFYPRGVLLYTIGTTSFKPVTLTMYSYLSVIFMEDAGTVAMPQMMNSFKLIHSARLRGWVFSLAALVAITLMFYLGTAALLKTIYGHGASEFGYWPGKIYCDDAFPALDATLRSPEPASNWMRVAMVLGAGFTLLLVWLHTQYVWWPVSPIGFVIASAMSTNWEIWSNAFIAWAATGLIRRYGGLRLYRKLRPAFLGLVLGQYLPAGFFAILSSIFGIARPTG